MTKYGSRRVQDIKREEVRISTGAASLQESLQDQVDHPQQEDNDRDLVDAVHHFEVDIGGAGRVLLAEEVTADLAEGE